MAKGGESKGVTLAAKDITISDKCPQDETPDISPIKKGKQFVDVKKKGTMPPPEDKKKGSSKSKFSQTVSKVLARVAVSREGTSVNSEIDLGPNAFVVGNLGVAQKLFQGLVLPIDQVELDKMDFDRAITTFFHVVGQVIHRPLN